MIHRRELFHNGIGGMPRIGLGQGHRYSLSAGWAIRADTGQVVLFTPGEVAADEYTGYLTNLTVEGAMGETIRGANILIERE